MKQASLSGKFYGATNRKAETQAFVFEELVDHDDIDVPLHTHEEAHYLFVVNGLYKATIQDKKQSFSTPSMLYYPAGITHRDHFYSQDERRFLTISLTSETSRNLSNEIDIIDHSTSFNFAEISWLGKRIRKELQTPDNLSPIVLDAMATELLVYSARNLDRSEKAPAWLRRAYELINDCCTEPITIAEIAAAVGVHSVHLARTFRRFFHCSPAEYLRKCRIELASSLLLNSEKTIVDIALTTGFADQSQFTQSFKQNTGITPAKFRQMH